MELKLITREWERSADRIVATSKRDRPTIMKQQFRRILTRAAEITPPGSEGVKAGTRAARKQGEAAVAGDIARVYGTPGAAYDLLERKSKAKASAFWLLHQSGQNTEAHRVLYEETGLAFSPFDGGKAHKGLISKRGRVERRNTRRAFLFAVQDPKALADYVKEKQDHVHWLAAGWRAALLSIGGSLPAMISRHPAPGSIEFIVESMRMVLRAHNEVTFASHIRDFERRLQWAMDATTESNNRQWDFWVKQQALRANFKTS